MKYLVSFFVIIIAVFYNSVSKAENLTVFIDMDKVMNESTAGKSLISKLEKINQKNIEEFKTKEDQLREDENLLLSQKNILSEDNYTEKLNNLREKVSKYNKSKQEKINSLSKKKNECFSQIIK